MQGAAVGRYDIEANRQPEAGSAAGAVARSFRPVKAFAQAGQLLIADAGALSAKSITSIRPLRRAVMCRLPPLSV